MKAQATNGGNGLGRLIAGGESAEGEDVFSHLAFMESAEENGVAVLRIDGLVARALLLAEARSKAGLADALLATISRFADEHMIEPALTLISETEDRSVRAFEPADGSGGCFIELSGEVAGRVSDEINQTGESAGEILKRWLAASVARPAEVSIRSSEYHNNGAPVLHVTRAAGSDVTTIEVRGRLGMALAVAAEVGKADWFANALVDCISGTTSNWLASHLQDGSNPLVDIVRE